MDSQNEAACHATKLAELQRNMDSRIGAAEGDVTQAISHLASVLTWREAGKSIKAAEIAAARKQVAAATQAKDDLLLMRDTVPALLQEARAQAQSLQAERVSAMMFQARKKYDEAKAAMARDLRSLGRNEMRARALALRELAQRSGCMNEFRQTMVAFGDGKYIDLLADLT